MSTTSIMCIKCGGCPAYANLITCLFCEDGVPCPCGGWQKLVAAEARTRKKSVTIKKIARPKGEPGITQSQPLSPELAMEELAGGGPRASNLPNSPRIPRTARAKRGPRLPRHSASCLSASPALSEVVEDSAPEVRPVRFDGDFLARRMREFYGSGAAR